MFDLVSFPIIPALLVSPKPLAQSWSPRFKNTHTCEHTHVYLCKETHMHEKLDTREHTFLSHDSGSRPPASGELPGYLQHLELAVPVCRRTKWGRERERGTEAEAESWIKDKWGRGGITERMMRDIWARHLVKRLSDRDTRQRFGTQREEDGKSKNAAETKAKVQIWCYQYAQKKTEWRSRACYVI